MTQKEIAKKIESLESSIFYMQMQSFINWELYNKWKKELKELKKLVQ